jgi:polysaccharide biosynthesis/export protein
MIDQGRWTPWSRLVVALGIALASTGCQALVGPNGDTSSPGPTAAPTGAGQGLMSTTVPRGQMPDGMSGGSPYGGGYPQGSAAMGMMQSPDGRPGSGMMVPGPGGMVVGPDTIVEGPCTPGCVHCGPGPTPAVPTELAKVSQPSYRVSPPDILYLDTLRMLPKPPYRIEPLEVLGVQVTNTLPNQPIAGRFLVTPDGAVNLGFSYGSVRVSGMTLQEAEAAMRGFLGRILRDPQVSVTLEFFRGIQQTRGEHLVRPDGTISLGTYGCVYVAGLTMAQIRCAIEKHLSEFIDNPEISVDVYAYNSHYYYVIADGGGYGQQVIPLPSTGYETVLDAIGKIGGLPAVSSKRYIWVARPSPCCNGCSQILPVDWNAITQAGVTCTNYQIFPGDRIYIKADPWICADNWIAKILSPIERILGVALLAGSTAQTFSSIGTGTTTTTAVVP